MSGFAPKRAAPAARGCAISRPRQRTGHAGAGPRQRDGRSGRSALFAQPRRHVEDSPRSSSGRRSRPAARRRVLGGAASARLARARPLSRWPLIQAEYSFAADTRRPRSSYVERMIQRAVFDQLAPSRVAPSSAIYRAHLVFCSRSRSTGTRPSTQFENSNGRRRSRNRAPPGSHTSVYCLLTESTARPGARVVPSGCESRARSRRC